jgi:mono/diheme cytochrome c family protein
MNRFWAYTSVLIIGFLLPLIWLLAWLMTSTPAPSPFRPPAAAIPPLRLPHVPLPTGSTPQDIALRRAIRNGERVYQRLCYNCHGRQGKGDNNAYMESIGHKPADHTDLASMQELSDQAFFIALRDGVKDERGWLTMPPWSSVLSEQDMWDVITYVRHLPAASAP